MTRELTPKDPDQILKIDLSSLPEERFPAVAWLYQRRTFVWKTTGGFGGAASAAPDCRSRPNVSAVTPKRNTTAVAVGRERVRRITMINPFLLF